MTVKLIYPDNTQATYCFVGMFKVDNHSNITLYFEGDPEPIKLVKVPHMEFKFDNDPKELTI